MFAATSPDCRWRLLALLLLAAGIWLRLESATDFRPAGTDEFLYGAYVKYLNAHGLTAYPQMVDQYIETQSRRTGAVLPPLRATYILGGAGVRWLTGWEEKVCLNTVSVAFSILALPLALIFAWRAAGPRLATATLALLVCAPLSLMMSRHAMIDIVVAFGALAALWTLWEALQKPDDPRWLAAFAASVAFLVMTKENSAFVVLGLGAILAANPWLRFGTVNRSLLAAGALGLLLGATGLALLAGGVDRVLESYRLLVTSAYQLDYAIRTGDGPWHRYAFEQMLVSPLVFILALFALARLQLRDRPQLFLAVFVLATYAVMASVKYGLNLRYTAIWDFPLRFLAATAVCTILEKGRWRPALVTVAGLALLAASDLRQYRRIFVEGGVYEPVTPELLHAVDMLKPSRRQP